MYRYKHILIFLIFITSLFAESKQTQYLGLSNMKETVYIIGHGDKATEIKRVFTTCAKNKGFIQDMVPAKGITPVSELEIFKALNEEDSIVVDMRVDSQYYKSTIPHAINIPFGEIEVRLDELGCNDINEKWDCSNAKKVFGFCNGPVCAQSPTAMRVMIKNGFPAEKIFYYRGGMLNWDNLGLTTVPGEF